jgi:mono/diheme cytochrome c family protein
MTRSIRRALFAASTSSRHRARVAVAFALLAVPALALGACGSEDISLAKSNPNYRGAEIFQLRCGGCHTLDAAGTEGSATNVRTRENKDGPNFNQRKENVDDVLYAIRNGGFSSGPMPQNIVVGEDAQAVAEFVAKYSGQQAGQATEGDQGGPTQTGSGG